MYSVIYLTHIANKTMQKTWVLAKRKRRSRRTSYITSGNIELYLAQQSRSQHVCSHEGTYIEIICLNVGVVHEGIAIQKQTFLCIFSNKFIYVMQVGCHIIKQYSSLDLMYAKYKNLQCYSQ